MRAEEAGTRPADNSSARVAIGRALSTIGAARAGFGYDLTGREHGEVLRLTEGVARVSGLPGAGFEEVVRFGSGALGLVLDLDVDDIGVVLLDHDEGIEAGSRGVRVHLRARWRHGSAGAAPRRIHRARPGGRHQGNRGDAHHHRPRRHSAT